MVLFACFWLWICAGTSASAASDSGLVARRDYVGSTTCGKCHSDEHESWMRTYHRTMTQLPTRESVLGRFDGAAVSMFGASARPFAKDGGFYFELPAMGGELARVARVALCVGSHRYQQYFEQVGAAPGGAFRRLPLVWQVGEARWTHLNAVFLEPDSTDWAAHVATWNENCIFCHNTGPAPHLRVEGGVESARRKTFDSRVAELGIACEACHGPGAAHVADELTRYSRPVGRSPRRAPTIAQPRKLESRASSALCGQCHSQRLPDPLDSIEKFLDTGPTFRPGSRLAGHVTPITRDTPTLDPRSPNLFRDRFWGDGTARLSAYEYLGVTQSPCFAGGNFECTSCHSLHTGDVRGNIEPAMRGDEACTQCHRAISENTSAHTHHAPSSSGSRCLECHMPRLVYGILTIHRSHRVEVPDVRRDVESGRPNACTECHLSMSALQAADAMREWWGAKYQRPRTRPDRAPLEIPEALASLHSGDAVQRAVYANELARSDQALAPRERAFEFANLIVALGDAYPSIRELAQRSLIELDRELDLGLAEEVRAFDHLAPLEVRNRRLGSLLDSFASRARAKGLALRDGTFVSADYRVDLARLRELLELQAGRVIAIGE